MPAHFRRIIHQQVQVLSFETFYGNFTKLFGLKKLSLSDLVTMELPQSHSCPKLPVEYQFSHHAV